MSGEGREAAEPGSEAQGEAREKITPGNIQGSSLEQKQPQPAAEPSATTTSKCGGESTATAQKRQILPSIPQGDTGPCVYSSKKSMEEMEKALSDFSGSVPEAVLETHHLQGLQRAGFRRGSLHSALAPSSLQAHPAALLPLEAHRQGWGIVITRPRVDFMCTLLGRDQLSQHSSKTTSPFSKNLARSTQLFLLVS